MGTVILSNISFSVPQKKLIQVWEHYEGELLLTEISFFVNFKNVGTFLPCLFCCPQYTDWVMHARNFSLIKIQH